MDAAVAFKALRDSGARISLKDFCEEHAEEYEYKPSTLYRTLSDNRFEWDREGKYGGKKKRTKRIP